jgi:chloramphenicol-sensitive protein RarD
LTTGEPIPTSRSGGFRGRLAPVSETGLGTLLGLTAYGLWGLFPLYFDALKPAGAWEILSHRILWTLLLCIVILTIQRDFSWIGPLFHQPKVLGGLALAALFVATNWVVYVAAVIGGHTSEAALGYFLNPLVTVALGVVVLGERLRMLQWVAVGIGVAAALFLGVAGGRIPVIALVLAGSFAFYGLIKKKLGATLPALHGLTIETLVLAPVAALTLIVVSQQSGLEFGNDPARTWLLVASGVVTGVPLLCFAAAARRIPLVTIGLIQFVTPVMQLLCAVLFLGEHMPGERWIGFSIVWVALIVLTADSLLALRGCRAAARREAAVPVDDLPR